MTNFPDDLQELYFEFGLASEMAQVMEMEAGNLALSFVAMCIGTSDISDEKQTFFKRMVEDVNKRTLGYLLNQIGKMGKIDDGVETIIYDALEKRNYLTHKFFRTHNFAIHSETGRKIMKAEIQEIHEALSLAHAVLSSMTNGIEQIAGLKETSEQIALELMAEGKKLKI